MLTTVPFTPALGRETPVGEVLHRGLVAGRPCLVVAAANGCVLLGELSR